ncbi:hypothetical protein M8J76_010435 [Diaphorina citri]|nr:hypothetical protein M8J75_005245 [Diaphorina citri]KAI5749820.1 hypothetical protein M8J76_010435 [Diaphorina citri]
MSPVQFRKDKKNKDTRSHICQRTVCHVSNLHQLPIKKSQTFASKRITGKRDNNLKKVWTEPKQSARSVFTPSNKNSKRFATLKKAISCSSIEEYGRVPCSVCQCDICAKFDYVFYGDNKMSVGDGNFIKRCTPCDMCIRTCQSDDRSIPVVKSHASPLTTPKSKKKFRDESSFATYARAISDVCLNQPSLQKEDNVRNRTSNGHSYPVSRSEPTNVYYTHQWKHINDLNRSSRYLFYSNLENFYRQLYLRARERTIAYSS